MDPRTNEHGRFYVASNGNRRFAGSASGIYLADTICHTLLSTSGARSRFPGDAGIMEAFISQMEEANPRREDDQANWDGYRPHLLSKNDFADESQLWLYFHHYFSVWHPLFPFLEGASLRDSFSLLCLNVRNGMEVFDGMTAEDALVLSVTLEAVFQIGGQRQTRRVQPARAVVTHLILAACEAFRLDYISAIRALFAVELSLWFARRFRPASHISGLLSKLVFESGLHRCPCRYPTTFTDPAERDLRKRLFYSIYVLDRLLCRHLGLPISLRDIDIDVCLPGAAEIHGSTPVSSPHGRANQRPSTKRTRDDENDTPLSPTPVHPSNPEATLTPHNPSFVGSQEIHSTSNKLLPAFSLAQLAGIMGRAMEVFNGSRRWRLADMEDVNRIRSELDEWWLGLELDMQDATKMRSLDSRSQYYTLFRCLYNHQIIQVNRHSLSISIDSSAYRNALQAVTLASRRIASFLADDIDQDTPPTAVFWPMYVEMAFDAGLLSIYGCAVSPKFTEDRAFATLRQATQVMLRLSQLWDGLLPATAILDDFKRRLDPHPAEGTTGITPNFPLDWLDGIDFNLEANPAGPELFFGPQDAYTGGVGMGALDSFNLFARPGGGVWNMGAALHMYPPQRPGW